MFASAMQYAVSNTVYYLHPSDIGLALRLRDILDHNYGISKTSVSGVYCGYTVDFAFHIK